MTLDRDRLEALTESIRLFSEEREWQRFHNVKNLAMALAGEVGELVAELQWVEAADLEQVLASGTASRARIEQEVADVFIYLLRLADVADLNLVAAAQAKLEKNRLRYDVDVVRGSAEKRPRAEG